MPRKLRRRMTAWRGLRFTIRERRKGDRTETLVIKAEDLAAAEDPAVARMESMAAVEKTDKVPPVACRLVMDEHGLHTVKAEDPPKPEKPLLAEIAEKVPDVDAGERLLDDLPCAITGLKVYEFVFNLNRAGMVLILPESDRNFLQLQVTLTPDQWKRLVEVVPKVMKILRIE